MRAKMVRPIALRLTAAESRLLDAWLESLRATHPDASASDVLRLALVATGLDAVGREQWSKIAADHKSTEEWQTRLSLVTTTGPWRDIEEQMALAPGSDADRLGLRGQVREAIEQVLEEHERVHTCSNCKGPLTSVDLARADRKCPHCGTEFGSDNGNEIEQGVLF